MPKADTQTVARLLREYAQRSALRGGNPYRTKAYSRAADSLLTLTEPLEALDPAVNKLLAVGAVLHVQTAVPELYFGAFTWSDLHGVTRNPWDLACKPGSRCRRRCL